MNALPILAFLSILFLSKPAHPPANNTPPLNSTPKTQEGVVRMVRAEIERSDDSPPLIEPPRMVEPALPSVDVSLFARPSASIDIYSGDDDLEYKTILTFIQTQYRRVSNDDAESISHHLVNNSRTQNLDPKFVAALMARESSFNKLAVSSTGAMGLGQIKSFNFPDLGIHDPFNIGENTKGTAAYLRQKMDHWKNDSSRGALALACYFRGYGAISRAMRKLDPTTAAYVQDIFKTYDTLSALKTHMTPSHPDQPEL